MEEEFDPALVAKIVAQALEDHKILPLSFIETTLFDRLNALLCKYMPQADVVWVISELKQFFFEGFTQMTSQQLQTVVHHCVKCPNVERPPEKTKWNLSDPDLLIVLDNPMSYERYGSLLTSQLKSGGFSSSRCALTYVSRCKTNEVTPNIISNCIPYLHTEIAVLNPKLIMTLGKSTFAALTGDNQSKLNDVRDDIIWFGPYAILAQPSLGTMMHAYEKSEKSETFLDSAINRARAFLYGGS